MTTNKRDESYDGDYTQTQQETYLRGRRDAIKDMHRSGGLSGIVAANELLLLLPPSFLSSYERLFWTALSSGSESGARDKDPLGKASGNSGTVLGSENRLQASGTGKKFKQTGFLVASEAALDRKRWVDQKLDGLVKDIDASLRGESLKARQCTGQGCKRLLDRKWAYCPWCGVQRS